MKLAACVLSAAAVLLASGTASANLFELGGKDKSDRIFHSPQNFALELRFAPYHPAIDDEPDLNGQEPYKQSFGGGPRLYFGMEFDWEMIRIPFLGTLGPGIGIGRVGAGRHVQTITGRDSADETDLTIYPIYFDAVLRADGLFRAFRFPLVPYGKVGFASGIWRASNSSGTSTADNVSGKGVTWGGLFAVGGVFLLDSLDPGASRNMDNATGINTTGLFFELTWMPLTGIAQDHPLYVGSTHWTAGITFEF